MDELRIVEFLSSGVQDIPLRGLGLCFCQFRACAHLGESRDIFFCSRLFVIKMEVLSLIWTRKALVYYSKNKNIYEKNVGLLG